MIGQEKDRDHLGQSAGAHVNVRSLARRVVQIAAFTPMHRSPDDRGRRGVRAAGRVNAQLPAKRVGRGRSGKGHAGPIARSRRHPHLSVKPGLEGTPVAPHPQVREPRPVVMVLLERKTSGQDKGRPADGHLMRRTTDKAIETADGRWDKTGRVAVGLGADDRRRQQQAGQESQRHRPPAQGGSRKTTRTDHRFAAFSSFPVSAWGADERQTSEDDGFRPSSFAFIILKRNRYRDKRAKPGYSARLCLSWERMPLIAPRPCG